MLCKDCEYFKIEYQPIDKDINVRSKDEPQTCSISGRPYSECADCEHFRCTADEPQTDWKDQMWAEAVEQSGKE